MDGCWAAGLAWGIAWPFACKTMQIEKSSKFKSSKYGSQSIRVQISAKSCWVVLAASAVTKSVERRIFHQDMSYGHRGPHVVSKALGRCRLDPFASRNQWFVPSIRKNCRLFRFDCFFPPLHHSSRSTPVFRSYFILKTRSSFSPTVVYLAPLSPLMVAAAGLQQVDTVL